MESQYKKGLISLVQDSSDSLRKVAHNEFNFKYFSIKECCDNPDLKLNFLVKTLFDPADCCISDYLNKKFEGKPEKVRIPRGEKLEITWECGKLINLCIK